VSDKSDACAAGGVITYGDNCRSLRAHVLEYNRSRNVRSLFVGDEIRIANEAGTARGRRFDLAFGTYEFRGLEVALPGSFQINNAAIAVTLLSRWLKHARPAESDAYLEAAIRSGLRDA